MAVLRRPTRWRGCIAPAMTRMSAYYLTRFDGPTAWSAAMADREQRGAAETVADLAQNPSDTTVSSEGNVVVINRDT